MRLSALSLALMYSYVHREQLNSLPPDAEDLSFGNSVYKVAFEKRSEKPIFGHKYWFFLQDAVDNVPEYVVYWDNFVQYVFFFLSLYESDTTHCEEWRQSINSTSYIGRNSIVFTRSTKKTPNSIS